MFCGRGCVSKANEDGDVKEGCKGGGWGVGRLCV